jgi:redox-sensitive bicupin YhaK (pirin superfamily)
MTDATVRMILVYLKTASIAAAALQSTIVLPMIFVCKVPEAFFETGVFRLAAAICVFALVAMTRCAAYLAYLAAVHRRQIEPSSGFTDTLKVRTPCRHRWLVLLHMQFARKNMVADSEVTTERHAAAKGWPHLFIWPQRGTGGDMTATTDSHIASQWERRRITARTKGRTNGPITQFVSPSDLGQSLKPFVMLARYAVPETASFNYPMHPHSGIASLAVIVDGALRSVDSKGKPKTLERGSVELLMAGRGIWHGGPVNTIGATCGYLMWLALPPEHELGQPGEAFLDAQQTPIEGAARVLLGRFNGTESAWPTPLPATCLHVELREGDVWRYDPPEHHDVLWLTLCSGLLDAGETLEAGELAIFERSHASVTIVARSDCSFILGSAQFSQHDIVESHSSVHTSHAAMQQAEDEIARLGEQLNAQGRLTAEQWESAMQKMRSHR